MLIACIAAMSFVEPVVDEKPIWEQVETHWVHQARVELETDGGPLPFIIEVEEIAPDAWNGDEKIADYIMSRMFLRTRIVNGPEVIYIDVSGGPGGYGGGNARGSIVFEHYRSKLEGEGWGGCIFTGTVRELMLEGVWTKERGRSVAQVPFTMIDVDSANDRFDPIEDAGEPVAFTGRWSVDFDSSDDLAIGTFSVDANQIATGTFLTTTGDYRYLAGRVDGNLMRLSTFDGAHAFLFHARMQADGSIEGDFWSGNWWHETWTAVRDDDAKLPDAFEQTVIADEEALAEAVFKDLEGEPTRVLDVLDQTQAKARIIEIFGTWCPNCSDAGRELVSLKEQYGDDLAIVGLAFEITEDFDRSVTQVRRHHEHIGTSWPILIAGLSDKDKATAALGFLDQVRSYPTLVFLNEANEVQAVYSGFSGPATGDAYKEQRERFEALIDGLIEE